MFYGTALVMWGSMFADMLDTPVAKLAVGEEVDFCKDLFDGLTL